MESFADISPLYFKFKFLSIHTPPPQKKKQKGWTIPQMLHFFERKVPDFEIIILKVRHSEDKAWGAAKERVVKDGRKDLSRHPNLLIKT